MVEGQHQKIKRKPVPITNSILTEYAPAQQVETTLVLGVPRPKGSLSYVHVLAATVSLCSFVLGVLAIVPALSLGWRLQFSGQIILIGFLLSIMNMCMHVIVPLDFLLIEARFGESRLQNFEAILTGKFAGSHISRLWRLALLTLLALPLGLSVAYKQFLGGTASAAFSSRYPGRYGIDFPRIGSWSPSNDALYLLITSFAAFQTASGLGKALYPGPNEFPLAYGYNTLLLSNDSAAILDIPTSSYISALQSQMSADEVLDITASVDAYVATYNTTTTMTLRTDDALWVNAISSSVNNGFGGLSTMYLYQGMGARIGMLPFGSNNQMLFALYYNSTDWGGMYFHTDPDDPEFVPFRSRAQMYSLKRARCRGHWTLNTTSILLLDGSCDSATPVSSSVLLEPNMCPFPYDILPSLAHTYSYFANNKMDAVWLQATYAMSVVTMYWARGEYILYTIGGLSYAPIDENIVSTRSTLRPERLLYLVLAVQPVLTVLGFVVAVWLYKVPIGTGFGIISILSGVDPASLSLIQGAGLSGELREAVKLDITSQYLYAGGSGSYAKSDDFQPHIRYCLRRNSGVREKTTLKRGWMYW